MNLDDPEIYEALDPGNVLLAIDQFADSIYNRFTTATPAAPVNWLTEFKIITPNSPDADWSEVVDILRAQTTEFTAKSPAVNNAAKRIAGQLVERLPIIHGGGIAYSTAVHWKYQLNCVGKNFAHVESLQGMGEQALDGLFFPKALTRRMAAIILSAPAGESAEDKNRLEIIQNLYLQMGIAVDVIRGRGDNVLAQTLALVQYGDYVAYYVAIANGVDPALRPATAEFQARLAHPPSS